jgi:hypothetical protein
MMRSPFCAEALVPGVRLDDAGAGVVVLAVVDGDRDGLESPRNHQPVERQAERLVRILLRLESEQDSTAFNESTDSASAPRLLCAALNQATASASYAGLLMKKFVMNCFKVRRAARARREGKAAILPRSSLRMVSSEIVSNPPRFCTAYWIRSSVGFVCST